MDKKTKEFWKNLSFKALHSLLVYIGFVGGFEALQIMLTSLYVFGLVVTVLCGCVFYFIGMPPIEKPDFNNIEKVGFFILSVSPIFIMLFSGFVKEAALFASMLIGLKIVDSIRGSI